MSVLQLKSFGGEIPRVPARHLPDGAAVKYENLLATAEELRPLQDDKDVAAATANAKTLYRLSRAAGGALRHDDSTGWLSTTDDLNYVKSQLNDDATERTVVTDNSGTAAPRVIDTEGEDRLLGVPAPPKLGTGVNAGQSFTLDDATVWVDDELMPALVSALQASLTTGRIHNGKPIAGTAVLHANPDTTSPGRRAWHVTSATADALNLRDPSINGYSISGGYAVSLYTLPLWAFVDDVGALKTRLRAIESPRDGSQAFSEGDIDNIASKMVQIFDPGGASIAAHRSAMDRAVVDLEAVLTRTASTPDPGSKPQPPTKPTVPEWLEGGYGDSDRRLKENIVLVGEDAATKLPLYEFNYRRDQTRRYRGVMSDDVRRLHPGAVVEVSGYDRVNYAALGLELVELS